MGDHTDTKGSCVLRTGAIWQNLRFYQKADALYQLTVVFCKRFLPLYGDRTVDQMVQAARSGKQNIVEGSEDGKTSTEMELKLLNVARASISELREDYKDFLNTKSLPLWDASNMRYAVMQKFCREHNTASDFIPYSDKLPAEEFANMALTLCYQVDVMMNNYLKHLEKQFVTEGGIKERMYAARTGFRRTQDARIALLEQNNRQLAQDNNQLAQNNNQLALENRQLKEEIARLKSASGNLAGPR